MPKFVYDAVMGSLCTSFDCRWLPYR